MHRPHDLALPCGNSDGMKDLPHWAHHSAHYRVPQRRGSYCLTRKGRILVVLVLWLLQSAALAGAGEGKVRVAGSGWVVDAPTKIADRLGLFGGTSARPPVQVDYHASGLQAMRALLAGQAEFALAAPLPVAAAILEHAKAGEAPERAIVVLASVGMSNQSHYVVANRRRGVLEAEDLVGRRIGLPIHTSAHYGWYLHTVANGLDPRDMQLMDIPVDQHAHALQAGEVDAVVTWDPFGRQLLDQLGEQGVVFSTRQLHSVNWLLVTTRDLALDQPALVRRILYGYLQASDLIFRDPARARAIHAEATDLDVAELERMEQGVFWNVALNWAVLTNLEAQLEWLARERDPGAAAQPVVADYLHPAPLNALRPRAVMLPRHIFHRRNDHEATSP